MATRQLSGFRQVLGHFASGVTIVTGITEDGPAGFTCQSFSSLSLDPPLVLVLPSRSSTSWPRIAATGRFCVNILADHQGRISSRFAKPGGDKFADVAWTPSALGLPILKGSCAWIECHIEAVHSGGDHHIIVGAVQDLASMPDSRPLLFHRGAYAGVTALRA
jgi:flavin reductase (DIM6/NTAB) family NADH-FMN oxidoreductase RutF